MWKIITILEYVTNNHNIMKTPFIQELIKKFPNNFSLGKEFRKLFPKNKHSTSIGNDYQLGSKIRRGQIQPLWNIIWIPLLKNIGINYGA